MSNKRKLPMYFLVCAATAFGAVLFPALGVFAWLVFLLPLRAARRRRREARERVRLLNQYEEYRKVAQDRMVTLRPSYDEMLDQAVGAVLATGQATFGTSDVNIDVDYR